MIKPGIKTTEFYLTLLTNFAALIANVGGTLPTQQAIWTVLGANGLYTVARGIAKVVAAGGGAKGVISVLQELLRLGAGANAVADPPPASQKFRD